ncbi:MAG TPA: hypothetical protein VGR20_22235 [Acidimicrobiia bacterium]|nr:hypothetical protein [Acidimicrobiia bacterium]
MLKRVSAALLFAGLLLGLTPTAAGADPYNRRDDHYRCMYHCSDRAGYDRGGYDRGRDDRYRYGYRRPSRGPGCWHHDWWGWRRCGYGYRQPYRYGYGYGYGYGYSGGSWNDSYRYGGDSDGSGGYDSHRHHPRDW